MTRTARHMRQNDRCLSTDIQAKKKSPGQAIFLVVIFSPHTVCVKGEAGAIRGTLLVLLASSAEQLRANQQHS